MSSTASRGASARPALTRDRVAAAAVALADEVGLEATSMRRLAEALAVTPMALYKHIAGREELLDAMVERLVEEMTAAPEAASVPWKARLRAQIMSARTVVIRHPWAVEAIETRSLAGPRVLGYMDRLMGIMFDGGLSADLVHHAMHALSTRMWGITRDVLPTPRMPDDPAERVRAVAGFAEAYPGIVRMATTAPGAGEDCDADAEFAFALDILLDAFERLHAQGWSST